MSTVFRMKNKLVALALVIPFVASCASPAKTKEYETEITSLREERTMLKKENAGLRSQLDAYEVAMAGKPEATPASAPKLPDIDQDGVTIETRGGNPVITLESEITFESGRAELTSAGKDALRKVADVLKGSYGDSVYWVEGHTDTDPIKKSKFASNRDLSVARAMSVLHFLVEDCGLGDDRCIVAGHGEYSPVQDNTTKAGKKANRRVEIIVRREA